MAVRQDKVQIILEFLNEESKSLGRHIIEAQNLNKEIAKLSQEEQKLGREFEKATATGKSTLDIEQRRAKVQADINDKLMQVLKTGKGIEGLDLSKVVPSQLISTAKELERLVGPNGFLPKATPQYEQAAAALKKVNDQLATNRAQTKGVAAGMQEIASQATSMSRIFETAFGFFAGGGLLEMVTGIIGKFKELIGASVKASDQMEQSMISFEVMLGSAAAARKLVKEINNLAANTPFETTELADYTKRLLAMGVEADKVIPSMTYLGNIAAGVGKEKLPQLVLAFGQVQAKTKLAGGELKQFVEAGVPLVAVLAKTMNVAESSIFKMVENGKIGFSDVEKAIASMSAQGGQFENLMARQSKTLSGLWSTFKDNFTLNVLLPIGNGIAGVLKPALAAVTGVIEQLIAFFQKGTKPVGEYAEVVQFLANILRGLVSVFGVVWEVGKVLLGIFWEQIKVVAALANRVGDLIGWFVNLAQEAKKIPFIGGFFKPILDAVGLLSDLLSNASATFGGFRAAAGQAITNVQNYLKALVIDAEIVGSKLAAALSFNDAVKKSSAAYVATLEAQKNAMFKAGKTVEQAYTEGRNAAIAAQNKVEAENEVKKKAAKAAKIEADEKAEAKAEKERLSRIKKALELELDAADIANKKEALVNEISFLKKEKTESDFNKKSLELERDKYAAQIRIFDTYQAAFSQKSKEFQDLEIKKLEAQKKLIEANAALTPRTATETETLGKRDSTGVKSQTADAIGTLQTQAEIEQEIVRKKFENILGSELAFNAKRLQIQSDSYALQLEALRANGLTETAEYRRIVKAKNDIDKQRTENSKTQAEIEATLEAVKRETLLQSFEIAIQLLTADESARKKHASAIKAFQIGQVVTNGILEVQKIWATVADLGPFGPILGGILTAFAVARAGIAVNKISNQKFAKGGFTPRFGYGADETGEEPVGIVHAGEWVGNREMVEQNPQLFKALETMQRGGKPFADGGYVGYNVIPKQALVTSYSAAPSNYASSNIGQSDGFERLIMEFQGFKSEITTWQKSLEVKMYYTKFKDDSSKIEADLSAGQI